MLQPFTERQYSARAHACATLSPSLKDVIPWWIARLQVSERRHVSTVKKMPAVIYTDASGAGHISAVVILDGVRHTAHTHAPEWFMRCGASILELELLAELLGLMLACELAPGRPVLLCCDNSGAAATVVRGSCLTVIGRMIVSVFWATSERYRRPVWVEGVASGLNPADDPSRVCPLIPVDRRCLGTIESAGIPNSFITVCGSRFSLAAAQFSDRIEVKGRPQGWPCFEHKPERKESTPAA